MQTTEMPEWVDRRHADLNHQARAAYRLRDRTPDEEEALKLHNLGDYFFAQALAITEEWEEPLPTTGDNTESR